MEIKYPEVESIEEDEAEEKSEIDYAELELIKRNPYNYICDFYEKMFPRIGRKVFSILSLVPCSILIPKIDSEVKQIKQKISLLWISPSGCMPRGSKVLMSNGKWKNIEDIREGDEVISPQNDGTNIFSKVKEPHKWISPKNYKILLEKDKRLMYKCSFNHKVPYYDSFKSNNKWKIKKDSAEYLFNLKQSSIRFKRNFSTFKIEKYKDRENCKIEPYSLGVFLGDGCFSSVYKKRNDYKGTKEAIVKGYYKKGWGKNNKVPIIYTKEHKVKINKTNDNGGFTTSRRVSITSANNEIMEEVSKYYPIMNIFKRLNTKCLSYVFSINGEFAKLLTNYGLSGKDSANKFIPKDALLSDIEYRKKLLSGLIDTDGYFDKKKGIYSIVTKSEQMAEDIKDLIFSLGNKAKITKIKKGIKKINFIGEYYDISFCFREELPLKLEYKKNKRTEKPWQKFPNTHTVLLEEYGSDEVYGFEVDSPSHNFITDNWMVTGNSGKTSIGSEFKKIAYNPLLTQKITPARLVYEINKITKNEEVPKLTLIVSDIAQMFSDEEFIKLLEGVIGDEAEFSRNTMKNAKNGTSKKIDACAYLSGTSKNIFDNKVRDGILGRCSSLVTFFSEIDNEEIINHINSRMGKPIKNNEKNIIKDFYQDLYSIQLGNHKTIEPIEGYEISEEIRDEIGRFILGLKPSKVILQKWGLTSARILEETYRFLVNHAFLNIYNRKIINNKIVISKEDLKIAKELAYQESVQTFRILRGIEAIDYFNIQTERDLRNFEKNMEKKNKPVPKEMDYILRGGLRK